MVRPVFPLAAVILRLESGYSIHGLNAHFTASGDTIEEAMANMAKTLEENLYVKISDAVGSVPVVFENLPPKAPAGYFRLWCERPKAAERKELDLPKVRVLIDYRLY